MAINPKGSDKANTVPSPPHRQTASKNHNREANQLENDPHFIQPKPKRK
jgi:hypothetical protein